MAFAVGDEAVVDGRDDARVGEGRGAHGHRRRAREEELDRVLEPIEDEATAEEVNNYKDDEAE